MVQENGTFSFFVDEYVSDIRFTTYEKICIFRQYFKSTKYLNIQMDVFKRKIVNDFLLPNQKICANVTIIKFELV